MLAGQGFPARCVRFAGRGCWQVNDSPLGVCGSQGGRCRQVGGSPLAVVSPLFAVRGVGAVARLSAVVPDWAPYAVQPWDSPAGVQGLRSKGAGWQLLEVRGGEEQRPG